MIHVISQTRDEKRMMYRKLTKRELIEMVITANEALDARAWPGAELVEFDSLYLSGPNTCQTS